MPHYKDWWFWLMLGAVALLFVFAAHFGK